MRKFDGQRASRADARRARPDRRPRRPPHERRHLRRHRRGRAASSADLIDRLETHTFEPVKSLQWRNRDLDFASLDRLRDSLREAPREGRLARARAADDMTALETVSHDREVAAFAGVAAGRQPAVGRLPDARLPQDLARQNHAELVATLYKFLMGPEERIPQDWFAQQVALADRTDGDIDTLATRIAHIRTWTFVSQPGRLAGRPRALAGAHPRDRGQPVRRAARAADPALRRPAHQRADEGPARRRTSSTPRSPRTAPCTSRSTSSAACRASASFPTRRPRASTARPRATPPPTCSPRSSAMRVRRVGVGQERCLQADARGRRCCGARRRSRGWRPARTRSSPSSSCSPTSTWPRPTRRGCRSGSMPGSPS